jgi:DNA repair exonuclease SbcCD ATPase subunit
MPTATATYEEKAATLDQQLEALRTEMGDPQVEEQRKQREASAADFMRRLEKFLRAYENISSLNSQWRKLTFCGDIPFSPLLEREIRNLLRSWNWIKVHVFNKKLERLRQQHAALDENRLAELSACGETVTNVLTDWQPPALSSSPAFRTITVPKGHPLSAPCPRTPGT